MERITSKLTRVLVVALLSVATLATAGSLTLKASSGVKLLTGTPLPSRQFEFQIKSIGRVKAGSTTSVPDNRSMCDKARDARARNSPAAPNLEAQCRAQMAAREPVKSLGRVKVESSTPFPPPVKSLGRVAPVYEMPIKMCDNWQSARARNSPAAPNLAAQCWAQLAARGAAIESEYPWAADQRSQQPNDEVRRGFDIGMGAAYGQTAPAPANQVIGDSLTPAEQQGYRIAVSYSLTWNSTLEATRNELAAKGAQLATADQEAVGVRNQQPEGPVRRGFDIGMAAAAEEDSSGTGKKAIRASLSPEEQEGFDTAVLYSQLRRNNPRGADMASDDPSATRDADVASAERSTAEPRPLARRPVRRGNDSRSLSATLEHLKQGMEYLEAATPDQDGHVDKAIDNINSAIQELEKALRQRLN